MIKTTEWKRDSAEELIHAQEVSVQDSQDDLRFVPFVRNATMKYIEMYW